MAVRVIEPHEVIDVRQICCLIYGQPGSRKSSSAQTADEPITMAFDQGVYRAYGRKRSVFFDTWEDVNAFDLSGHKTVVVDTVGMCLDKLAEALVRENPKNGNKLGGLSLPGFGQLKARFAAWVNQRRQHGQDLVFLAHERSEKVGDETYYSPDIVGGSYNTLMNVADVVGYLHFENGKRVLDFAPTDRWMAKCPPCGWGQIILPDFGKEPHFLGKLLAEAKASMGRVSEASALTAREVGEWLAWLASDPSLEELNERLPMVGELTIGTKRQVWHAIEEHGKRAELVFDAKAKQFAAGKGGKP